MEEYIKLEGIFENGYGFIAKKVMLDSSIPLAAKGFYAYLCSFSGKGNDIFPSRKRICNDLNIGNDTLSKYISFLAEKKLIEVNSTRSSDGQFSRNIYKIKLETPCTEKPCTEKTNTVKLNTNNNNILNNNNNNISSIVKEFENEIGFMTPFQLDKLQSYTEDLSEEMIIEAIHIASSNNKKNLSYIEAILKRWISEGVKCPGDIKEKKSIKKELEISTNYLKENGISSFDSLYDN